MKTFAVALTLLLAVNSSFAFNLPCPAGQPVPLRIVSPQCTAVICTVFRGQNLQGEIDFASASSHSVLTVTYTAVVGTTRTPLPVTPGFDNACTQLSSGSCPTVPNQTKTWNLNVPIPLGIPQFTGARIERKLLLLNIFINLLTIFFIYSVQLSENGVPIVCANVLANVN